ncbi:MAG: exodeoxyribonuclease VII small subunit [Fimbriimonadales bacterium]|nr:exodeoxyribonuclease VII small subunit [Fimbriimonadales bacterium]
MPQHDHLQEGGSFSFEEALARLEEIVTLLESGNLTLDETVSLYEEGQQLRYFCERKLREAEQRITYASNSDVGSVCSDDSTMVETANLDFNDVETATSVTVDIDDLIEIEVDIDDSIEIEDYPF